MSASDGLLKDMLASDTRRWRGAGEPGTVGTASELCFPSHCQNFVSVSGVRLEKNLFKIFK
jgi:hypothetical protein